MGQVLGPLKISPIQWFANCPATNLLISCKRKKGDLAFKNLMYINVLHTGIHVFYNNKNIFRYCSDKCSCYYCYYLLLIGFPEGCFHGDPRLTNVIRDSVRQIYMYNIIMCFYSCGLSTATIECSYPSVSLSWCLVFFCVHDNSKNNGSIHMKLEHTVV